MLFLRLKWLCFTVWLQNLIFRDNGQDSGYLRRDKPNKKDKGHKRSSGGNSLEKQQQQQPTRIVYQFLYNNNSRQLTEVSSIATAVN